MSVFTRWSQLAILAVCSSLVLFLFMSYICPDRSCGTKNLLRKINYATRTLGSVSTGKRKLRIYRFKNDSIKRFPVFPTRRQVMVFLHMQKTGGTTFGKHLVQNLNISYPCKCRKVPKLRCKCTSHNSTRIWLFSRYSLGWPCGLHSDWTELHACVPDYVKKRDGLNIKRQYLYVTFLREPTSRVLSEFRCYQRGTTWAASSHKCNGRTPTKKELPPCYEGDTWEEVTVEDFLACKSNLAFNRQARMLADLRLVNCYNITGIGPKKRDKIILKSAMRNLQSMAYFGLTEYQKESQYLFEKTFGVKFFRPFAQKAEDDTRAADVMTDIEPADIQRLKKLNIVDIRLYAFAKELFFYRVKYFKDQDKRNIQKKER
ncbi:heparan-sulfate 6-O-sulfotransferase 1-B-like [Actinia tenebrosa]|uniref:Heparan-sulfate 6-O-sulfotransferase n=1 Tax=Actinia tenebrosa TaxID=6105 RepID=A0A6P8I7E5_ACTTE|nr:heparan-sulfate 6-O-sulfotransferase 1-B-like [Actinia tenebrosa]